MPNATSTALEALLSAAEQGDLGAVESALALGPDINGKLPLRLDVQPGSNALVPRGGKCALHLAVENNHRSVVERLVGAGANPDVLGDGHDLIFTGEAAIHVAVRRGDVEMVRLLLSGGANPHLKQLSRPDVPGKASLQLAAGRGHIEVAKLLLLAKTSSVATKNATAAALWDAAEFGQLTMTQLLLANHPNINKTTNGWTPLMMACYGGFAAVAELLLDAGADLHKPGTRGMTATYTLVHGAHMAPENTSGCECPRDHMKVAELLIARGADVHEKSYLDQSPLEWARKTAGISSLVAGVLDVFERDTR